MVIAACGTGQRGGAEEESAPGEVVRGPLARRKEFEVGLLLVVERRTNVRGVGAHRPEATVHSEILAES